MEDRTWGVLESKSLILWSQSRQQRKRDQHNYVLCPNPPKNDAGLQHSVECMWTFSDFQLHCQSITSIGLQWKAGEFGQRVTLMVTDESWAEKGNQTVRAFKEKKVNHATTTICYVTGFWGSGSPWQPQSSLAQQRNFVSFAAVRVLVRVLLCRVWVVRYSYTPLNSVASDLWGCQVRRNFQHPARFRRMTPRLEMYLNDP